MSYQSDDFSHRLRRLNKKRRKDLKKSRSAFVDSDGYVIVRGYEQRRGIPMLGLMLLAVGFFGLKGAMMAQLGDANYTQKIESLGESESSVAVVGVWSMQPDPVSSFVADQLRGLL